MPSTLRTALSVLVALSAVTLFAATTPMRDPSPRMTDATDPPPPVQRRLPSPVRGVWMATVEGLDLPEPGLSPGELEAALRERVRWADEAGMNALFVQVRAEGDALYASELEPWNRNLTGVQGQDPGVDPLRIVLDEAHGRGLQVHGWINPFRAAKDRTRPLAETHLAHRRPDLVVAHGKQLWFNPSHPEAQAHTRAVVADLLARYDLDGIHLDDYFYPYPIQGEVFEDGGRTPAERQAAVDRLIGELAAEVRATGRPFTISPFGLHPEQPDFRGFDPVAGLHADPLTWSRAGQLDALVPQVYFPTDHPRLPHTPIATWWCDQGQQQHTPVLIGHAIHPVIEGRWEREELTRQASARPKACPGAIWFRLAYLEDEDLRRLFREEIHGGEVSSPD